MNKKDIVEFKESVSTNHLSLLSAGLSYYALFALVPAISAVVLIYAWVSDPHDIAAHMEKIRNLIPSQMFSILKDQFTSLANKANNTSLGLGALISLAISLWGASKATRSFMESLNMIEEKNETRSFIKSTFVSLFLTGLAVFLVLLSLGVLVVVPVLMNILNLQGDIRTYAGFIGWGALIGIMMTFLNLAYRYGPDRSDEEKRPWFYRGSLIATLLWIIISVGFSWYAKEFGNFNKSYGSLGAMIVLMTWFYLSSFSFLIGGQLNRHRIQKKSERTKKEFKPFKPVVKGLRTET